MTHTLHRRGAADELAADYVILAMAARGHEQGAAQRLRGFLHLALRHRPLNFGDMKQGSRFSLSADEILAGLDDRSIVHAVLDSIGAVADLLAAVRAADLGLSVVVSGLLVPTSGACRRAGLPDRRTVQLSLGVWGDLSHLPTPEVLEVTSMCGHGLVAAALVETVAAEVRVGRISTEEGARRLAGPCVCGVFNPERAAALLTRLSSR